MNIKSTKFSISQFKKTINSRKRGGFLFFILTPEIADFLIGGKTKNQLRINNRTLDRFVRNIKSGLWEFYNEKIHIIIEENKKIKSAKQNGDKSYTVEYSDGTTKTIAVSNDAWDKINDKYGKLNEAKEEPSKEITDMATRGYDYKDEKNYDNVFGQEFLKGYYTEMKDPKNTDKHVEELRAIVAKNLAKDINFYVKDGQFGIKGVGYQTEAPGLGTPKEAKGKYKASGYGDLKESVLRSQIQLLVKEILTEAEEPPKAALTASEKLYDKLGSVKKAIDALPEKFKEYKKALEAHLNFKFRD
jgi:hypothetical protein